MRGRIRRKDYFGREHGKRNYIDSRYDKNIYIEISQCLSPEEIQPLVDATHRMSGVVQVGRSSLGVNNMIARIKDFLSFLSGLKDKTSYPIETAVCLE